MKVQNAEEMQMPKIIFNVKEQLLTEAKKQVAKNGYAATTMRSVAGACGFAVGTMYNYFDSKEMLIATFVAEEWNTRLEEMATLPADCPKTLFFGIYDTLTSFIKNNEKLFSDSDAAKILHKSFHTRHKMLRDQLASFILPICLKRELELPEYTAAFVAETIISSAVNSSDFEKIYPILERIIKK